LGKETQTSKAYELETGRVPMTDGPHPNGADTGPVDEVDIGERLRAIRTVRRHTLKQVAGQAGLSESFLSQVERGQASVSIVSLKRIAAVLGINISDLFAPDGQRKPHVLTREARPVLSFGSGRKFLLTPRPLSHLEVFICQFEPGGSTGDEPYTHGDSEELVVVIAGAIQVQLGAEVFPMTVGDAIDYRSSVPHRVVNVGSERAEAMFVISPPSF
jgi:transcriptional regulator with XRE-family HTH domain